MLKAIPKLIQRNVLGNQQHRIRNLNVNNQLRGAAYEGDGRTSVTILNKEADLGLMVNGVSQVGFRLNNDITVLGPMIIFPRTVLSWTIDNLNDINEDSLSLFSVIDPKLDMIVLGVGDPLTDLSFQRRMFPIMKKLNINFEILATEQACSTFNFLNSEGRYIAGAMIPPQTLLSSDDDIMRTKLRYQKLYETDLLG